jgi:site-specific DNA-methyltransferase (adenine-specific)
MLLHGDCLDLLETIEAGSVDAIIADLPYGTTACKWDAVIPFEPMWREFRRVTKPNAAIVLTASQPFTSALVGSNLREFRHSWIWRKNAGSNFGAVKHQPMKEHEDVLVFARDTPRYFPQMQERAASGAAMIKTGVRSRPSAGGDVYGGLNKGYDNSSRDPEWRYPSSVQGFNRERGLHPTQKPVALMEYLIRTYTNEGETVLDPTCGSGTTGVACVNTGRKFIGIERDADYFAIAERRIAEARNATPLLAAAE